MSEYNVSVEGGASVRLLTTGKYCDRDIVVTATKDPSASADHDALIQLTTRMIEEFEIPKEATYIGASAFNGCAKLKTIKIHDSVTAIKSYAFNACRFLELKEIPAGIATIEKGAFVLCNALSEITFKGTPTSIDGAAFDRCTNLKTINVPWAEGEVANAPWGTNATINYNYTEG